MTHAASTHAESCTRGSCDDPPENLTSEQERPGLAPGVRLHGQMPGVGFTSSQWLIERNQQFLQVSELLYRVAEQMDGTRTVPEIAAIVTETSEWALEPEHVHHLLEKKLRPLGVVAGPNGAVPARPASTKASVSPLRLQMRMRMIPPRLVERFTDVFQYAYAPALLIPIAALIAVSHWWLYFVSGFERGLESSLYQPGALGAVVALAIAAGLFHELGHSSALKYGGGQPRGIGFGLYLMFPAFYSDVTDSYRLGRLARIRTDLGGIYFHLIFAAGLIAISAWTGNRFLIAAALLFNVEALRQFIPFVRLDGYWLLADLTGVPDFMSQIGSFMRSVRPGRRHARSLPLFKPWVTVVFGLYLLLSIPAIVYVVALMVMYLPELAALTQKALQVQTQLWSTTPEPLTRALIVLQIALVPLPLAAASYFVYLTFTSVAAQLVARSRWNAPAPAVRRLAGATALAAAAAFAAIYFVPAASPAIDARTSSATATLSDPAALLQRAAAATARARSMHADLTGTFGGEPISGTLVLSRPNRARVDVRGAADSLGTFNVISDGANLFVFFPDSNQFTQVKAAGDGANINAFIVDQVRTFFSPDRLLPRPGEQLTRVGQERIGGTTYEVVELRTPGERGMSRRFHVSNDDHLVHRIATTTIDEGRTSTRLVHLENIRIDAPVDDQLFRWALPADAKPLGLEVLGGALPLKRQQN